MKELGGFTEGGSITYTINDTDYDYEIGGIVSEMQYGNYGAGLIGGYLPAAAYENLANGQSNHVITEYSIRTTDTTDLTRIKKDITALLGDKGITILNMNDKTAARQTRTMVCTLLIIIFLSLAAILAIQSGFIYTPAFDIAALLIVVIVPTSIIFIFAYISAMKIHKTEPIDAIRGITGKENAGQNILLSVLSVGIMVLLSFAGTLFYNVSAKPDNFMNTLSEESPSVIFKVQNDKMSELKNFFKTIAV